MERLMNNLYWLFLAFFLGGIIAIISACATTPAGESVEYHCTYSDRGPYMTVERCGEVKR